MILNILIDFNVPLKKWVLKAKSGVLIEEVYNKKIRNFRSGFSHYIGWLKPLIVSISSYFSDILGKAYNLVAIAVLVIIPYI